MERRITKSHPGWEKLDLAANDLAIGVNPHVFFWGTHGHGQPTVINKAERIATVEKLKNAIAEHLEGGPFADWSDAGVLFIE